MTTDYSQLPVVNLRQGEIYIAYNPSLISTILGSCVSVTLFNRQLGIGGMCHGFLPSYKRNNHGHYREKQNMKMFVDYSIEFMLQEFSHHGIRGSDIEAKIFGGANMLFSYDAEDVNASVAYENIHAGINIITSAGLKLSTVDVGGSRGRKLIFNTSTGEVLLKRISYKVTSKNGMRKRT